MNGYRIVRRTAPLGQIMEQGMSNGSDPLRIAEMCGLPKAEGSGRFAATLREADGPVDVQVEFRRDGLVMNLEVSDPSAPTSPSPDAV